MSIWSTFKGLIDNTVKRIVRVDASTHALECIDYVHHEIHAGNAFHVTYENLCTNANEMSVIAFTTPDTTKEIHMIFKAGSTSISRFAVYRDTSIDVDEGTQQTPINSNPNIGTASTVLSIETTPVADKVTVYNEAEAAAANITKTSLVASLVLGAAGIGANPGLGGTAAHDGELILERDTEYAFIVESLDASDNYHTVELDWYEHTPKG